MKYIKTAAALVTAVLAATALAGCGGNKQVQNSEENKVKFWIPLNSSAASVVKGLNETRLAQQLMEDTGIDIEFIHPPQGQDLEKFNLLVATDDLPDIITYNWLKYPGGPQKAIREKVIIDLNEYKDKAPNLNKYLEEHGDIKKLALTDEGQLFSFPFVRGDESLCVSSGIIVRQDWLDDLGMELPETIDEWEKVLTAFKEKKGATAPFTSNTIVYFTGGFNTSTGFHMNGDKVVYGPFEPGYKDFLVTMNRWYKNGLIDADFATRDTKTTQSNMLNGVSGAAAGSIGSGIGAMMSAAKDTDGFKLSGAPFPTAVKGQKPEYGVYQLPVTEGTTTFSAISTSCKNLDAAFKLLDYGYSEKGSMLYNFGIEGESYEMKDGYPTYTENITNNDEGLSMTSALAKYTMSYHMGPFVQDVRYMEQYAALPEQKEAWKNWSYSNQNEHALPHLYMKDDELSRYADLKNSVDTRAYELMLKYIVGTEPIENYDSMISELRQRGADELLAMQQAAYDRYKAR